MAFTRLSAAFRRRWLIQALFMVRASNIIRRSTDVQCAMNRMNLLWTVPIPVELPCRGGTAGSGLVAGVGMGHVHDRRPYERTGPSAVDLILRFIADGPVIWEGWRRTAMAPPGLRLLWGRAHGPGAARGVRGAWRGGRPSAVAEPDSRLTSGFEMECAWPAAVASQKTVGGFPRIAWRTAGHIARRVAARLEESSMPCMFDGPTAIGVDETSHRKGAHVHHRGRRPQAQTGRLGTRRIRQGGARPVLPTADRRAARLHTDRHRRRRQVDRRQREGAPAERRARPGLVPHRLLDERCAASNTPCSRTPAT